MRQHLTLVQKDTPQPWERQPGEGPKPFQAFVIYRDLGATRSSPQVAEQLSKSGALIRRWSSRWAWVERCAAWDNEQDRLHAAVMREELRRASKRQANIAAGMLAQVAGKLRAMQETADAAGRLTPTELARWAEVASRIEREAYGAATLVVENRGDDGRQHAESAELTERILSDPVALDHALGLLDRLAEPAVDAGASGD